MSEEQQEKHGEFERESVPESKTRGLKALCIPRAVGRRTGAVLCRKN